MIAAKLLLVTAFTVSTFNGGAQACVLNHYDSGECVEADQLTSAIPFCSAVVKYSACLPRYTVRLLFETPVKRAFIKRLCTVQEPFTNHTSQAKDAWVASMVTRVVAARIQAETSETLKESGEQS